MLPEDGGTVGLYTLVETLATACGKTGLIKALEIIWETKGHYALYKKNEGQLQYRIGFGYGYGVKPQGRHDDVRRRAKVRICLMSVILRSLQRKLFRIASTEATRSESSERPSAVGQSFQLDTSVDDYFLDRRGGRTS